MTVAKTLLDICSNVFEMLMVQVKNREVKIRVLGERFVHDDNLHCIVLFTGG